MVKGAQCFQCSRCEVGVAFAPGKNNIMQDRYTVELDKGFEPNSHVDHVAVVGGIGTDGKMISILGASNLNALVRQKVASGMHYLNAIEEGCMSLDKWLHHSAMLVGEDNKILDESGATCCAVWITDKKIFCCNLGDCCILMSHDNEIIPLTKTHVPRDPNEGQRIANAGGIIHGDKIDGKIKVSRAFGLFAYKGPNTARSDCKILAMPSVCELELDHKIDYLLLASGAIFEVLTIQQVFDFVQKSLEGGLALEIVAQGLVKQCENKWHKSSKLEALGNFTCAIIRLTMSILERKGMSFIHIRYTPDEVYTVYP